MVYSSRGHLHNCKGNCLERLIAPKKTRTFIYVGNLDLYYLRKIDFYMIHWISKNGLYFIGAFTGALAGFLYWKYVGCVTGTCAITSNPFRSTIYFAFMGALFFGLFKKRTIEEKTNQH